MTLPDGYRIEWGGQFENMQRAQKRLTIVVPLALLLIVGCCIFSFRQPFRHAGRLRQRAVRLHRRHRRRWLRRHAAVDLRGRRLHHALGHLGAQQHGLGLCHPCTLEKPAANLCDAIEHSGIESPADDHDDRAGRQRRLHPDGH